ncbi:MAG TPA: hypothetical protein VFV24_06485, partial [Candidatus Eisenbacteria bacterium]|nr:hypothetical protein [Candidatus Eisenbacteria bacterium]
SVDDIDRVRAATNAPMVLGALGTIERGLIALRIPHGAGGVQQAVEYLGREFSASRIGVL